MKRLIELTTNAGLFSLRNPATQGLFLYVMQNAHGLIKIGRSDNPQRRVLEVQKAARCAVALIVSFPEAGHFEEWIHLEMAGHRIVLEWFEGTAVARAALAALLGVEMAWVYQLDEAGALAWTERQLDSGAERYWRRRERDVMRRIKGAVTGTGICRAYVNGSVYLDGYIAPHVGFVDPVCHDTRNGRPVLLAQHGDNAEMTEVPAYTRSMEAAQSLWLPDPDCRVRPDFTRPVECCFHALCDRLGFDPERLSVY